MPQGQPVGWGDTGGSGPGTRKAYRANENGGLCGLAHGLGVGRHVYAEHSVRRRGGAMCVRCGGSGGPAT
eukprot:3045636-Prymnesium_polylepis.1